MLDTNGETRDAAEVPTCTKAAKPRQICRHCNKYPVNKSRGLCWRCYFAPGVRDLYPSKCPQSTGKEMPCCWSCGIQAPRQSGLASIGWQVRKISLPGGAPNQVEVYCRWCQAEGNGAPDWDTLIKSVEMLDGNGISYKHYVRRECVESLPVPLTPFRLKPRLP